MGEAILTAVIAGVVSLVIALLSSIFSVIALFQSQKKLWQSGVTEKRMNWISEVRNIAALLLSYDHMNIRSCCNLRPDIRNISVKLAG